jgi:uncharacterized spore protein YtfJ
MTDENELTTTQTPGIDAIKDTMDKFIATGNVDSVYGRQIRHGDTIIIPSAEVLTGMGFGLGSGGGRGPIEVEDTEETASGFGGGGGGGGRILSRPVAVVISSPEGVRVEPVIDVTKIGLAALTASGFMFGMMMRMLKK